jgi:hypothetical protein
VVADLLPLASCTLLLPPFLPPWVGLLMMILRMKGAPPVGRCRVC